MLSLCSKIIDERPDPGAIPLQVASIRVNGWRLFGWVRHTRKLTVVRVDPERNCY